MKRTLILLMIVGVLIAGCSLAGSAKKVFGTVGKTVAKGATVAGKKTAEGTVKAGKAVGKVITGNHREKEKDEKRVSKESSFSERKELFPSSVLPREEREIYIPGGYLRREYLQEGFDFLETEGYTFVTRHRRGPLLRMYVSIHRVKRGGSAKGRILRRRARIEARSYKYVCSAYLVDRDGRVVARGWGESPSRFSFRVPYRNRLRIRGSSDSAKARAALMAFRALVEDHRGRL